jgi:HD-GYP domain-containing protein (c-di-GMP phosphodiesterase class II)
MRAPAVAADAHAIQTLGRSLIMNFTSALRTVRLHDASNKAVATALEPMAHTLNGLRERLGRSVQMQFVDEFMFINEVRIRVSASTADALESLRKDFEKREIGGIEFLRPVDAEALRLYLSHFARSVEREDDAEKIRYALLRHGLDHGFDLLDPMTLQDRDDLEAVRRSKRTFALEAYGRAIVSFEEVIEALRQGWDPLAGRLHLIRIVQDLIDIANERPDYLLGILLLNKDATRLEKTISYALRHAANTCIYAVLLGRVLGLSRNALLDLGTAAILAKVGFALLPEGLTERESAFSPSEQAEFERAQTRAAEALIGQGDVSDARMRRLVVAFEHQVPLLDPTTAKPNDLHPASRIVAVADAFNAMTTKRPWRDALSHKDALKVLRQQSDLRFDPLVVSAFSSLIASYGAFAAIASRARAESIL